MRLILCGPPFSGKSSVGQKLAEKLALPFIDTDTLIEKAYFNEFQTPLTCREIVKQHCKDFFRQREQYILHTLSEKRNSVIALGGGILHVPNSGTTIYLKASIETLWQRLCQFSEYPTYIDSENPKQSFEDLIKKRVDYYEKMADFAINTDSLSIEDSVRKIEERLKNGIK